MKLSEKLDAKHQSLTLNNLITFAITDDLTDFYNACQTVFISTLISNNAFIKLKGELYSVNTESNVEFFDANAGRSLSNDICAKKGASASLRGDMAIPQSSVIFDFFVGAKNVTTNKSKNIYAEFILSRRAEVVTADGTFDQELYNTLMNIHRVCNLATRDPVNFRAKYTKAIEDEQRAAARRAKADADAELDDALASGDEQRVQAAMDAAYNQREAEEATAALNSEAISADAIDKLAKQSAAKATMQQLGVTNPMSFILGWLAANVKYMHAQVPFKKLPNGRIDNRAEYNFLRNYPGTPKAAAKGQPGYFPVPHRYYDGSGKLQQRYTAYFVHFKRGAVQKAPNFVFEWLSAFESEHYHTASMAQGTMISKSLAIFLYRLGFAFNVTDSVAISNCRAAAANQADFDKGFEWRQNARAVTAATSTEEPVNELDLDFPEVEVVTASDYDTDYTN